MSYRNILVLGHPDSGKTTLLLAFASKNGTQSPTVWPSEQFISERIKPLAEESNDQVPAETAAAKTEEKTEQQVKEIVDQVEKVELNENKPAEEANKESTEPTEQKIEEVVENKPADEANQETTEATEQKVEKVEDKPVEEATEVAPAQQTQESEKAEPKPAEKTGEESKKTEEPEKVKESKGLNRKNTLKKTNTRISIKLDIEGLINNPENINFWYKTFGSDSRIIKSYINASTREAQENSSDRIDLLFWDVESLTNMPEDGDFSNAPFTFYDLDAIVMVYDVASPESFQKIPELKKELKKFSVKPAIFLIGHLNFFS